MYFVYTIRHILSHNIFIVWPMKWLISSCILMSIDITLYFAFNWIQMGFSV